MGTFQPVIKLQGGTSVELNKLSWNNRGDWMFLYIVGTGFQFYNGRILNEMLLKLNQMLSEERGVSFQISLYWK